MVDYRNRRFRDSTLTLSVGQRNGVNRRVSVQATVWPQHQSGGFRTFSEHDELAPIASIIKMKHLIALLLLATTTSTITSAGDPPHAGSATEGTDQPSKQTPTKNPLAPRPDTPTWTEPEVAARQFGGFEFLGEYEKDDEAIQVVPCDDRFYLSIYQNGLPGDGWNRTSIAHEWVQANGIHARLRGYRKIDRSSELSFPKPPDNAIVLFDGSDKEQFAFGKIKNGLLQAGAKTRREFQDFTLHFECILPFKPTLPLSHPDRGNSGVFAVGAYEIQIADTFGLDFDPKAWTDLELLKKPNTWCGSIYGIRRPDTNVCLPPLSWQTFDVTFTAARFDGNHKTTNARISVEQNGVLIHDDIELPGGTGGGPSGPRDEVPRGPILIQNHHNPTQYRNVWVIEN